MIISGPKTGGKTVSLKAPSIAVTVATTHHSRLKAYAADTAEAVNATVWSRAL